MGTDKTALSEPWTALLADLLAAMEADIHALTSREAALRLAAHGPNRLRDRPGRHILIDFASRFSNPLVLILIGAAAVAAPMREQAGFAIIAVTVLLSVTLDFVQEHRALAAADALRDRVALHVTALRDGVARDLFVNEALLTGEPYPAEKSTLASGASADLAPSSAVNAVFMGCSVISGSGTAIILATGASTQLGGIAGALRHPAEPTAFAHGIHDFGMLILRLTVLLVLFVLLINLLIGRPLLESFLFSLALAEAVKQWFFARRWQDRNPRMRRSSRPRRERLARRPVRE